MFGMSPGRVAQLVGACPKHRKVVGSIPGQGTYLGCGFDPSVKVHAGGSQSMFLSHLSVSLCLSRSPFLSL